MGSISSADLWDHKDILASAIEYEHWRIDFPSWLGCALAAGSTFLISNQRKECLDAAGSSVYFSCIIPLGWLSCKECIRLMH